MKVFLRMSKLKPFIDIFTLDMPEEDIISQAKIWEMEQGGLSGRTAQQFIYHLLGEK